MLVTYVPSPWRTSTTWMSESARIASRSELRETLRRAARSLSFGSRSPGWNSPELIISRIFARASSVTLTASPWALRPLKHPMSRAEYRRGSSAWAMVRRCAKRS